MRMEMPGLVKTIQEKVIETQQSVQDNRKVSPQTLQDLARAIKNLNESTDEITPVDRSHLTHAVENLVEVENMIKNLKRETERELEEGAREEVIAQLSYIPVHEIIRDLKTFLRTGKKVEKTYKPRTQ